MFVTLSSAPEPGSQPVSEAQRGGEVSGRLYLRKYQASSAMMSSSRDRTSTVGRTCWLGDVKSSEEGEAEGQGAALTKKKEEGARPAS